MTIYFLIFNCPAGLSITPKSRDFYLSQEPATINDDRRNSLSIDGKIAKYMRFGLPRGIFSELITLGPQFYAFLASFYTRCCEGTPIYL